LENGIRIQGVVVADEAGVLNAVQEHIRDTKHALEM
jgi:hypothetical protein